MKITMVAVVSTNGKLTRGDDSDIHKWTSDEDKEFFSSQIAQNNLIVMGSKTYDAAKSGIKLNSRKLRIVLTRSPEKYADEQVAGQLEFSSDRLKILVRRLEKKGYQQMLLAGGGEINSLFLNEGLVDEIYLTIEPVVFGKGKPLFADGDFNADLRLISSKKLNKNGTLLLQYAVINHTSTSTP